MDYPGFTCVSPHGNSAAENDGIAHAPFGCASDPGMITLSFPFLGLESLSHSLYIYMDQYVYITKYLFCNLFYGGEL